MTAMAGLVALEVGFVPRRWRLSPIRVSLGGLFDRLRQAHLGYGVEG